MIVFCINSLSAYLSNLKLFVFTIILPTTTKENKTKRYRSPLIMIRIGFRNQYYYSTFIRCQRGEKRFDWKWISLVPNSQMYVVSAETNFYTGIHSINCSKKESCIFLLKCPPFRSTYLDRSKKNFA